MNKSLLVFSIRILAMLAFMALLFSGECDAIFLGVFVTFFLMGLKIEKLSYLSFLFGKVQPVLALFLLGIAIIDLFYLSGSFLISIAHFLIGLQAIRLLALKTNRENLGSLLISSLMMLSAATLSVDWTFVFVLVMFLPMLIWCLMLHHIYFEKSEIHQEKVFSEKPFEFGSQQKRVLQKAAVVALMMAVLCCVFVFLVFPRFNLQGFKGQFLQPVHKTGFTNTVELGKERRIFTDDSVFIRVEMDPHDRPFWTGYLRGTTLDTFNGVTWTRSIQDERVVNSGFGNIRLPYAQRQKCKVVHQSIYMESSDSSVLFGLNRPVLFQIDRPFLEVGIDGAVKRSAQDTWRVHYELDSFILENGSNQITPLYSRKKENLDIYREMLPKIESTLSTSDAWRISEFSKEIVGESKNKKETAEKLTHFLQKEYKYSLTLPPQKKHHSALINFLFENKVGHCEYFASSLCLMLRSQRIPARIVTGFLSHEWNEDGGYYVVRMQDAHAWVEAYLDNGWEMFDPSPRDQRVNLGGSIFIQKFKNVLDSINLAWNRYVLSYDLQKQISIVKVFSEKGNKISDQMGKWMGKLSFKIPQLSLQQKKIELHSLLNMPPLFILMVLSVFSILCMFISRKRRYKKFPRTPWFYYGLINILEKKKLQFSSGTTLEQKIELVSRPHSKAHNVLSLLKEEYYAVRFGGQLKRKLSDAAIKENLKKLKNLVSS
ncbi:MAG: transglutaminaseTgpA domain-containing protein [Elusimicrobiota bacterium]